MGGIKAVRDSNFRLRFAVDKLFNIVLYEMRSRPLVYNRLRFNKYKRKRRKRGILE